MPVQTEDVAYIEQKIVHLPDTTEILAGMEEFTKLFERRIRDDIEGVYITEPMQRPSVADLKQQTITATEMMVQHRERALDAAGKRERRMRTLASELLWCIDPFLAYTSEERAFSALMHSLLSRDIEVITGEQFREYEELKARVGRG